MSFVIYYGILSAMYGIECNYMYYMDRYFNYITNV